MGITWLPQCLLCTRRGATRLPTRLFQHQPFRLVCGSARHAATHGTFVTTVEDKEQNNSKAKRREDAHPSH